MGLNILYGNKVKKKKMELRLVKCKMKKLIYTNAKYRFIGRN